LIYEPKFPLVVSLAAVLALAALVGITWNLCRALAARRWRAALDAAYAQREKATKTNSKTNVHDRLQSQGPPKGQAMPGMKGSTLQKKMKKLGISPAK
jgi:hypothetical protein